jgi:hypothetical protein
MPKKLSRRELRKLIAEAGSFEAPAMDPLSTGEVMDMMRRGEDVAGVERNRGQSATYDENRAKVDSMVKDAEREIVKIVEDLADIVGDRAVPAALRAVKTVIARQQKMDALRKQGL